MTNLRLTDKAEGVENRNNKHQDYNKISHDIVCLAFQKGNVIIKQKGTFHDFLWALYNVNELWLSKNLFYL